MALAQAGNDGIFNGVERREVDMAAFGCLDVVVSGVRPPQMRHAKAGARTDHADRALGGQRRIGGACQMQEIVRRGAGHGMGDGGEIVDDGKPGGAQLFLDQGRAQDPRIVGEADHLTADRTRPPTSPRLAAEFRR